MSSSSDEDRELSKAEKRQRTVEKLRSSLKKLNQAFSNRHLIAAKPCSASLEQLQTENITNAISLLDLVEESSTQNLKTATAEDLNKTFRRESEAEGSAAKTSEMTDAALEQLAVAMAQLANNQLGHNQAPRERQEGLCDVLKRAASGIIEFREHY